jgi:hypothetical protein
MGLDDSARAQLERCSLLATEPSSAREWVIAKSAARTLQRWPTGRSFLVWIAIAALEVANLPGVGA